MKFDDSILDLGLQAIIDDTDILHICSAQPANYAGIAAVSLGNKTTPTVGALTDGTINGRKITVSAITDGVTTADGTASYAVLANAAGTQLLAVADISPAVAVLDAGTFTLTAFDLTFEDPA